MAPVMPGLKPLTSRQQLNIIPSIFNVEIPVELYKEMSNAKTAEACDKVGEEWLLMQCRDLLKNKVPVLHFYTLGKPKVIYNVLKQLL
jgi:methylenetetrahydrofolate reductase (NADPH)